MTWVIKLNIELSSTEGLLKMLVSQSYMEWNIQKGKANFAIVSCVA